MLNQDPSFTNHTIGWHSITLAECEIDKLKLSDF